MRPPWLLFTLLVCGLLTAAGAADFHAGVASVKITPPGQFWMSGYASRNHPSEGVLQDLWAKALALRDQEGNRVVFVTTDLIGISRDLSDEVFSRAKQQFGLARSDLVLSCSHTHCGPAVGRNLSVMFAFSPEEEKRVREYCEDLAQKIVQVVGEALQTASPARLRFGEGKVEFAINRRQPVSSGVRIGVNTNGPVDHSVPVLKVSGSEGNTIAALFAYACHNTTLGGDFYQIHGDYAGVAQAAVEDANPGATALFMSLCGGDQNPNPRGTVDLARQHGHSLAAEVNRMLASDLKQVRPPVRTAAKSIPLPFAPHTREQFESEAQHPDKFRQRRARLMLSHYEAGHPVREIPFPVQVVRFGQDLTFLTLGGEVVVDYSLRAKKEFPQETLVVAGYCNDVMCYIPSRRVLLEGGYEAVESMIYYGMPGPFAESVEDQIFTAIRTLLTKE